MPADIQSKTPEAFKVKFQENKNTTNDDHVNSRNIRHLVESYLYSYYHCLYFSIKRLEGLEFRIYTIINYRPGEEKIKTREIYDLLLRRYPYYEADIYVEKINKEEN